MAIKNSWLWRTLLSRLHRIYRRAVPAPYENARKRYQEVVVSGDLVIKPSNLQGTFIVSAVSDLATRVCLLGAYEPELTQFLDLKIPKLTGDVVNIGANVGFLAIHIANRFPSLNRVIAIEPHTEAFKTLIRNIDLNKCTQKVIPINKCVSDHPGIVNLTYIPGMPEYSSMRGIVHSSVNERSYFNQKIAAEPLTEILKPFNVKPCLLLIDVEGAEKLVLTGAIEILRIYRPLIILELSATLLAKFNHRVADVVDLLEGLGYEVESALTFERLNDEFDGEAVAYPSRSQQN